MKKICLFLIVCIFSATLLAEEGTVLYYETFGASNNSGYVSDMTTDPQLTANSNLGTDTYKVDGNYYFNEPEDNVTLNFWRWGNDEELWPGASKGLVGRRWNRGGEPVDPFRIKLTTKDFQEAYFSIAYQYVRYCDYCILELFYSLDIGATWHKATPCDTIVYFNVDKNFNPYPSSRTAPYPGEYWIHCSYKENFGGREVVYLNITLPTEPYENYPVFDDLKVVGYNRINTENTPSGTSPLSPNPAGEEIRIAGAVGGNVYIFNAAGQQVASVSNYGGEAINISSLPPGIYTAVYGKQSETFVKR